MAWVPPSKREGEEGRLVDAVLVDAAAVGGDLDQRLVQPVEEDREVVGGEVEHDAVGLVFAEVHPRGGDEVDVAQHAVPDQVADLADRRAVEEGVAGQQHEVQVFGQDHQLRGLSRRAGQRLLDQHVLAGLQRLADELVMSVRRRRDRDGFQAGIFEGDVEVALEGRAGVDGAEVLDPPLVALAEAGEVELGPLDDVTDDVWAPVAVSDDEGLYGVVEVHHRNNGRPITDFCRGRRKGGGKTDEAPRRHLRCVHRCQKMLAPRSSYSAPPFLGCCVAELRAIA